MSTVYQVVVATVPSGSIPTHTESTDSDTTITLLTTISTTTFKPVSTKSLTTRLSTFKSVVPTESESIFDSAGSEIAPSSTSTLSRKAQTSMTVAETIPPGSSSSGAKLGLAIGIPIAVIALFVLIALAWVFLKRKIQSKSTEYLTYDPEEAVGGKVAFERRKEPPPFSQTSKESISKNSPRLKSRLSRMVNSEWIQSLDLKSPAFFKAFNLKKDEANDQAESTTSSPQASSSYKSKRPPSLKLAVSDAETLTPDTSVVVTKEFTKSAPSDISVVVGDMAVINFQKDSFAHVTLVNREGYGFVPISCLRRY
ncbi:hypothetical protein FDK38_004064 [Candidozyma auris]|nr:hypothetical protein FDK38_004064 [[Candida] auris]